MISKVRGLVWLPMLVSVACAGNESNSEPEDVRSDGVSPGTAASSTASTEPNSTTTDPNPTTTEPTPTTTGDVADDSSSEPQQTSENPDSVKGVTSAGSRCDRSKRLGSLSVNLGKDRTIVAGAISNGVLPSSIAKVQTESGGCELLVPRDLFCASCATTEVCAGNDMCVPKPTKVSAGVLTVNGLLVDTEVTPNGITLDYSKTILDPYPAYEVGANVVLRTAGDAVSPFEADVYGVPKLTSELAVVNVKHGEVAQITWNTNDVNAEQSSVFVSFSVNVHGAVTGWIECTAADTGTFEIPAELVSALIDLGLSGFPRVELERRSSATVELSDGCVDAYVGSKLTLEIEVDGLASCNRDEDCPDGQSCSAELACE